MSSLQSLQPELAELLSNAVSEAGVAGTVVGVWRRGERLRLAEGTANLNNGQAMQTDTLWLLGSITKVLTAELLLRYIQAGAFGLDDKLCQHLPEFKLKDQEAAAQITLRQLINHSNGIDSDTWAPETANALDASAHYVRGLQEMGVLFEPGSNVHYSNPGFVLAARLLEVHSGENFNTLLEREIFARHGMNDACTSAQQAILRGTAIGAFVDNTADSNTDKGLRATPHFMSVSTGAGAGTTAIVSVDDMLNYAEHHLRPGDCVPAAMARAMQTPQLPERSSKQSVADAQPGLGWWIDQLGDYRCLSHGGGSPGGLSQLSLLPELELAVVSFATGPEAPALHDDVLCTVVEQIGGKTIAPYSNSKAPAATSDFVGCYEGFQAKHTISLDDEQDSNGKAETRFKMVSEVPPFDEENRDFLLRYYGMLPPPVTRYFKPLGGDVIVEVGQDPAKLKGIYAPLATRSLERNAQGEVIGIRCGSRYAKKTAERS